MSRNIEGFRLKTVGELKEYLNNFRDTDPLVIETCDEDGDSIDLFPMSVDSIEIDADTTEVRVVQMPQKFFEPKQ